MVIIVICVRKWQDKNNDEHMANEKTFFEFSDKIRAASENEYTSYIMKKVLKLLK
jgi:hypothetical protein